MLSEELFNEELDEIFVDEELEDLEEHLNPELTVVLAKLARKAVDKLEKFVIVPMVNHKMLLRKALRINKMNFDMHDFASVLAIDSTWSSPPLELVWGAITIIVVGYVVATPDSGFHGISYATLGMFPEGVSGRSIEIRSKILEYSTGIKALRKYRKVVDAVLVDGPLLSAPRSRFTYKPVETMDLVKESERVYGPKLASYASKALIDLARECRDADVPLVGVVKRVGSKFLAPILRDLGLKDLAKAVELSNDKALASLLLDPGEYVELGNLLELLTMYLEYVGKAKVLTQLEACCRGDLGKEAKDLCNVLKDTKVVFYRAKMDSVSPQATRLDIYPSHAVKRVLRYVMAESSQNSVPIPIDLVDRFVRIEASSLRKFHEMLLANASKFETLALLGLTNPQKSYLIKRERQKL